MRALVGALLISGSTWVGLGQPGPETVDLVFYGDTRAGLFQSASGTYTPMEIHLAVASQIGSLTGLSPQRGILFVGDAVSHGGCAEFWDTKFFPVLTRLTAFRQASDYLIYPVIGDHETYLIPENYDEAEHTPIQCAFFDATYSYPMSPAQPSAALHPSGTPARDATTAAIAKPATRPALTRKLTREEYKKVVEIQGLPAQVRCKPDEIQDCTARVLQRPDQEIKLAHCLICQYQREVCEGNCASFVFKHEYTTENGFGPFQRAYSKAPAGATWYSVDWLLSSNQSSQKKLRVLFLDTQADQPLQAQDNKTQVEWLVAAVDQLRPGDDLILTGHQTPSLRPDLFGAVIAEAFAKGVRVLAVVTGHYHGFGSGTYRVSSPAKGAAGAVSQEIYFAVSGDGGSRDLSDHEKVTEKAVTGENHELQALTLSAVPGKTWQSDNSEGNASFATLHVSVDGLAVTDYRVTLRPAPPSPAPSPVDNLRSGPVKPPGDRFESHARALRSIKVGQ